MVICAHGFIYAAEGADAGPHTRENEVFRTKNE